MLRTIIAATLFVVASGASAFAQEGGSCAPSETTRRVEAGFSYVPIAEEMDSVPVTIDINSEPVVVSVEFVNAVLLEQMGRIGTRYIRYDENDGWVYTPYPLTSEGQRLEVGMVAVLDYIPLGTHIRIDGHTDVYIAADTMSGSDSSDSSGSTSLPDIVIFLGEGNAALARAEEITSLDSGSNPVIVCTW